MPILYRPAISFYSFRFFFSCLCFYFEHLGWWRQMRVQGGEAPTRGGSEYPSLRSRGRLGEPDVSRCALGVRPRTARYSPFWPQPVPGARKPASRAGNRMGKPARAEAGIQDAGVGCASLRGCVPALCALLFTSSAGGRPRFLAHPGPSLGSGLASLLRPSLCRTRRCLALPCLARVSLLPQHYLSAIFIHYLQEDAFGGILGRRLQSRSLRTALPEAVPC